MKIGKAPELLKKAATIVRSKASTVRARLLIVASLRRRMAMIGAMSHRIHALMVEKEKARVDYYIKNKNKNKNQHALRKVVVHDEMVITDHDRHLSELAMSNREDEGLEFNIDDEIDQAADMFIRRIRNRMNRSV
ncbi:Os09g0511200 [Oryza sativa Japonica Group]|uniref:Os09g0511200 protein n=1 Tax=Oryza sativa subsp. japonica TaxID=39947 RepID=C7J6K8_ORYSJ|nr:Os09g0511200 [Oryza sativa Japonica Group]|eukprot:NP_001175935.1 Os09g0511200 [Oryza sativa Japonica Group]